MVVAYVLRIVVLVYHSALLVLVCEEKSFHWGVWWEKIYNGHSCGFVDFVYSVIHSCLFLSIFLKVSKNAIDFVNFSWINLIKSCIIFRLIKKLSFVSLPVSYESYFISISSIKEAVIVNFRLMQMFSHFFM